MKASQTALSLIKEFEGFEAKPYVDVAGFYTWGYGHKLPKTPKPNMNAVMTEKQASDLLTLDVEVAEAEVNLVCVKKLEAQGLHLNQNQFDALVCFVYNVGGSSFRKSTMLKLLLEGRFAEAADEFPRWCKAWIRGADGKKVTREVLGLYRRRVKERALFVTPPPKDH